MSGARRVPPSSGRRIFPAAAACARAFTLVEVLVAVGITAIIASFAVAILTNVSGFWSRTSGRLSAEAQARVVLDRLTLDLQSALFRDDGRTWLAATIPANTSNTGLWNTAGAVANNLKPANSAGTGGSSLQAIASGSLGENSPTSPRFGIAGTWLRFFTAKRGSNLNAATLSAPVAVGYQIVRRATSPTPNNLDLRYLFHRTEVTPANTLAAGFDILDQSSYAPSSTSPAATVGTAREIRMPTLNSVLAENVIDFGVRLHVYAPDADGVRQLTQIFPSGANDLSHAGRLPAGIANEGGAHTDCFPEVVDVMVRILTDEGSSLLARYESGGITAPQGRTLQQYWWDLALANSQVFTRRIVLNSYK